MAWESVGGREREREREGDARMGVVEVGEYTRSKEMEMSFVVPSSLVGDGRHMDSAA